MKDFSDGFAAVYMVDLLFRERPILNKGALFESLKKRCPGAVAMDGQLESGSCHFAHEDHLVQFKEGKLPAQTIVMEIDKPIDLQFYESAIQQSWGFREAREVVQGCRFKLLFSEMMSSALPYRERIELFQNTLASTLDVVQCDAIYWRPTEHIIDPQRYRYLFDEPDHARFFLGALNVRLFNIEETAGDIVMDTLGLAALGLPDLQCHFRDLGCNNIARLLHNVGLYVFENGDIIEDGHTIEGPAGEKWCCQHEMALVKPDRIVLDINPGPPFAAGNRK